MLLPELKEIQKLRKKLGITQTELARKAGVSQSLIARLESGAVDPSYSKVADIFQALDEEQRKEITAEELMTSKVAGVQRDCGVEEAVKVMNRFKVSQIPVFDGKKVVGAISEKSILDEIGRVSDMRDLSEKKIESFMAHPFPIVGPGTRLSTLRRLLEHDTAVLVADRGDVKGIITNADLLKALGR